MGELEQEAIKAIVRENLKARVTAWNRIVLEDLRASVACGVREVHISAPASSILVRDKLRQSFRWVLDRLRQACRFAREQGLRLTVGAEDASRADSNFLVELAGLAQELGAERLRYCDTVGVLEPFAVVERLSWLKERVGLELEFHAHNDFGLALANTLAAVRAGVAWVDTTATGLGERAGNTSLEKFYWILKEVCCFDPGLDWRYLRLLTRYVARAACRPWA